MIARATPASAARGGESIFAVVSALSIVGPLKVLLDFLSYASQRGVRIAVHNVIARGSDGSSVEKACRVRGIEVTTHYREGRQYLALARTVAGACREGMFPIIETHSFLPTFIGLYARIRYRIPWVCYLHGVTRENLKVRLFHFAEAQMQRFADLVVLVAHKQRELIPGGNNLNRVRVVHNSVDAVSPSPRTPGIAPLRERFSLPANARCVVVVGRFSPEKGCDVFIDAFVKVTASLENVYAFLVGDGPCRAEIQHRVHVKNLDKYVFFIGQTPSPGDYMAECDCLVLPSRSEGIPNVVLEAMAFGRPVVATAVGGVPEIIRDAIDGILVPSENPPALAEAIVRLLSNADRAREIGRNGQKRVIDEFSPDARYANIINVYGIIQNRFSARRNRVS